MVWTRRGAEANLKAGKYLGEQRDSSVCLVQSPHFPVGTKGERILLTREAKGAFIFTSFIFPKLPSPQEQGTSQGGSGSRGGGALPFSFTHTHSPPTPSKPRNQRAAKTPVHSGFQKAQLRSVLIHPRGKFSSVCIRLPWVCFLRQALC